ncbi:TPA: restriction endonuclease subunit S [Vibrio cholerae]|nr:restriction endonuclease subunit S [Vibrio cholerae]HDZ9217727.1 restriction endonuclease subunit S [Vibrio cholerae]
MSWPVVKLGDVLKNVQPGFASGKDLEDGTLQVRMNNVKPDGSWDWSKKRIVPATDKQIEKYSLEVGDVLFNATNSAEQVGKSALYSTIVENTVCFSNHFLRLRTDNKRLLPQYLVRYLSYLWRIRVFENMVDAWVNQATVRREDFLNLEIPLPPLDEQKRIAAILDKADAIRQKRKQAITLADEFLRSVFLDMFGDPVTNPKGWDTGSMADFGEFKNGLNYSRDESGVELSYIGVGDFKSHSKLESIEKLSTIQLNENPDDSYLLKDNDLLFVRSNGNRALVGRCLTVHPREKKVTFSGFCIRYRVQRTEKLNPTFVNYCMRMPSMKNAMLKGGQGANIQNINQKTLISLLLPIPPQELQKGFEDLVNQYQRFSERSLVGSNADDALFLSLSQKAFSGQL